MSAVTALGILGAIAILAVIITVVAVVSAVAGSVDAISDEEIWANLYEKESGDISGMVMSSLLLLNGGQK